MNNVQYDQASPFVTNPITTWAILIYVLITALIVFPMVRRPLVHWYKSQIWFVHGSGILDILMKQIGMRLTVEAIAFGISCVVGPIGGFIYVLKRKTSETPQIVDN